MRWAWARGDREVRGCGWRGHVTYRPDETALASRLVVETVAGPAWRCLRCGSFVPGEPAGSGPANEAPVVLRGKPLRDAVILRLLAVDRFVRGSFLLILGAALWYFDNHRDAVRDYVERDLPSLKPLTEEMGVDLHRGLVHWIVKLFEVPHAELLWWAAGFAAYGCLLWVEGIGLWRIKRWGEYVAAVATAIFVPFEIVGLAHHVSLLLLVTFLINVFLVAYLVWTKRLFGVRGGYPAWLEDRRHTSLIEVEEAASAS